ncbi:CLIP-associated protein, partial [Sesamum angolense]
TSVPIVDNLQILAFEDSCGPTIPRGTDGSTHFCQLSLMHLGIRVLMFASSLVLIICDYLRNYHGKLLAETVVFCLVDIYIMLGKPFLPYLEGLNSTQLRL